MKRIITGLFIVFTIFIFNSKVYAYDYNITDYDVDIIVNENNTFDITERITAYFNVSKHGIYRTIPLKNSVIRLDGTSSHNRATVTNIKVDNEYTTSKENGNLKIKIGSPSMTLTGSQTYNIKYTYNIGNDPLKDKDELYLNIIGTEWDTTVDNITFRITMPKDFDKSKLGFSSGKKGSTNNTYVNYQVNDNVITGSYNNTLDAYEGLTIRCELPEGYFTKSPVTFNKNIYFMYIIPAIGALISFLLWNKYGRDDIVVDTVELYPPEGINSLDAGLLYKGKADKKAVLSLLIYLANKGYLKITEKEKPATLFGNSKTFSITRLKDYDGNDTEEEAFFNGLFIPGQGADVSRARELKRQAKKNGEKLSFLEALTLAQKETNYLEEATEATLYDNFYHTVNAISGRANDSGTKELLFEKTSLNKRIFIILLLVASITAIVLVPTLDYGASDDVTATLVLSLLYIPFIGFAIFSDIKPIAKILVCLFLLFHASFFFKSMPIGSALASDTSYLIAFIFGISCIIAMCLFFRILPKRTKYGNEMYGRLKGFKNFLETAEKETLEAEVEKNPTYFYDILPYTYALDISDKWIKKFETIALEAPDWYDSNSAFDMNSFSSFMTSTMSSVSAASTSSSDSSSGGGSSGGGSGGGGGGSW